MSSPMSPSPAPPPPKRMRSHSSLLIITATALATWIVATFFFSTEYHHYPNERHKLFQRSIKGKKLGKGKKFERLRDRLKLRTEKMDMDGTQQQESNHSSHSSHTHVQGKTMKKKLKSYINMTNYDGPSTTWKSYTHPFPCVDDEGERHMVITPAHEGLLFQRPVKTGSTTLTNIILRLVSRYALPSMNRCKYRAMHASSRDLEFGQRKRDKSYLLSVVRDPTHKAISRYFHFDVSVGQKVPTDAHFQEMMARVYNRNSLTQDLATRTVNVFTTADPTKIVQEILEDYDFIAVTERMDESLVVWKILFHLEVSDILYIKSRTSGSFSNGDATGKRPCIYLQPSFLTPGMQKFFDSDQWKQSNAVDILLYQAVYKSLDNTIRDIGKDVFDEELKQFQEAQQKANEYCQEKVIGFCSSGGILNPPKDRTCVIWGEGCDYSCLREFQQQQRG